MTMTKMGIEVLYGKPNTSRKHPKNKVHPYPRAAGGDWQQLAGRSHRWPRARRDERVDGDRPKPADRCAQHTWP